MSQDKRRKWTATEKLRIVMAGLQKDVDVAELCRREGASPQCVVGWQASTGVRGLLVAAPLGGTLRYAATFQVGESGQMETQ